MGMLERIKRKQIDGFKDFVQNLEITTGTTKHQIFTTGVLEDPLYMSWVMKNLKTYEDFINLGSGDINTVIASQERIVNVFAKCVWGEEEEKITALESVIPKYMSQLRDELSYLKSVTAAEKEGAKYFMVKATRKLMSEDLLNGFRWSLPPMDVYYPRTFKPGQTELHYESGAIAAKGLIDGGRRMGQWQHFYETGQILAYGDYYDGLKVGEWTFNYSSGKVKAQGKFVSDEKHGQWKEWDRNGELHEVVYSQGTKI
jgi:hypothetical protein